MRTALFSIETKFCTKALGHTEPRYLSRGSSFLLAEKRALALVSCSHIVHPFNFKHYYPEAMEWLAYVSPADLEFKMSLVHPRTGRAVYELDLPRTLLRVHPVLDLCAFVFPRELNRDRLMHELNEALDDETCIAQAFAIPPEQGADSLLPQGRVTCAGFDYSQDRAEQQVDVHNVCITEGSVLSERMEVGLRRSLEDDLRQELVQCDEFRVRTKDRLNMGMCGGPVLHEDTQQVLGMVEGIAPDGTVHCIPTHILATMFQDKAYD